MLRFRDVYPGSRILIFSQPGSWILDPKTATKERGEIKYVVITFYVATNFTKLQIISVLNCWRKKFGPIFKELYNYLTKIVNKFSKIQGWDPGSEIRDPEKTYSGSRIPKRHRISDPQHWLILWVVGASQLTAREGTCIKFASARDRTRVACLLIYIYIKLPIDHWFLCARV